jgi:hypothetical protein
MLWTEESTTPAGKGCKKKIGMQNFRIKGFDKIWQLEEKPEHQESHYQK